MRGSFRRRRGPLSAALVASLLAALGGCGAGGNGAITIGIAGPMSQANGRSERQAAQMAADEINQDGGIAGHHLALVFEDDQASAAQAIEVATKLRANPAVVAVVGHINSAASLAAAQVYNDPKLGVVEISPASSSPELTNAGPWTFRVCPSDLEHGPALADWIARTLGRKHAEVLYANDDYGRGVLQSFATAFKGDGGTVVGEDPYLPALITSADALDPYLERAMQRGMDALLVAGEAEGAAKIIAAARRLGYQGPVLGPDGLTSLRDAGAIAEGVYISSAFLPDRPTSKAQAFVKAYVARFHEQPDHRAAMTYDAVHLLARALAAVVPSKADVGSGEALRRAVRDYLAGVGTNTPAYEGVSGTIRFDANGDATGKDVEIGVVKDGELVTARG